MNRTACRDRNIHYRFPVLLYMAFLFGLSSMPGPALYASSVPNLDKLFHFLAYAGLGIVLMRLFCSSPRAGIAHRALLLAVLTGTLYGLSDEWHQSFIPGRDSSLLDAVSDGLGCSMAALLYEPFRRRSMFRSGAITGPDGRNST
ncbi:MAG: VanZ family protein [Syntrophaceae bacterium]|nr:VanZ family protein [Syntrophaceae bacterium]